MNSKIQWREVALLCLGIGWCAFVMLARHFLLGRRDYGFMAWNLMLASIPVSLSFWLSFVRSKVFGAGLLLTWLLFFPNAPYVLTDLIHLRMATGAHWDSVLMLVSFALVGLMLGFASLRQAQDWVTAQSNAFIGWSFVIVCMFMTGFGIYLGRVLRWNSWSIITHPVRLGSDVAHRFLMPHHHLQTWGITVGFGVLLLLMYAHYQAQAGTRSPNTSRQDW